MFDFIGKIADVISSTVEAIKVIAKLAVDVIKEVGSALMEIAKILGVINPEMEVDELGDKALQMEEKGIKPENFDSYEEYINKVQECELDPEKSKLYTDEQKLKKGAELSYGIAAEKCPEVDFEGLIKTTINDGFMDKEGRFAELCKMAVTAPKALNEAVKFINGKQKSDEGIESAISTLSSIEKKVDPEISDNDAYKSVLKYQK